MERHKLYSLTLFFLDKEEPHPSSKLKLWMGPENLGAVSYTHLDVYKRQVSDVVTKAAIKP